MFDKSNIILGFTGSIGSGCTYISKRISELYPSKYTYCKLSEFIRNEVKSTGIDNPSVEDLQRKGNELRAVRGDDILVTSLIDWLSSSDKENKHIIVDGIKNDAEVKFLRQFPNFYLFSVNADRLTREKRVVGPGKPFAISDAFLAADKRDEFEADVSGQQVKKCNNVSDIIIVNEKRIADTATHDKDDFVQEIYRNYVELIEHNFAGTISPQSAPSVNELCMTTAYALSKKSSCLKRKVGAVIIEEIVSPKLNGEISVAQPLPHIVASGYNEVPAGAKKCIFDEEYQKCYRDFLQEEYAKKMKHCPSCGHEINFAVACSGCGKTYTEYVKSCRSCRKEIKISHLCPECNTNIFEEHLPGGKRAPGKLLDLCRALHAEEMAILQLSKRGGNGSGNLVLFATTQPCNLCANKIATSGITKVVYAEPYDMKEAAEILAKGNVKLERFQGVKSSAYFKLYN